MINSRKIILFDIDYTLFDTDRFKKTQREIFSVYKDVHQTLETLSKVGDLGIFSEGNIAFQNKKLEETQIKKYFLQEHIHIVEDKIKAIDYLVEKYKNHNKVFLIDDRLPIFPQLKKDFPSLFTILMRQTSDYSFYQEPIEGFFPDAEIDNLEEVVPLVIKN